MGVNDSVFLVESTPKEIWLVDFGIKTLAGAPFSFQKGGFGPLKKKRIPTDFYKKTLLRNFKKSSRQIIH